MVAIKAKTRAGDVVLVVESVAGKRNEKNKKYKVGRKRNVKFKLLLI